jgi:carbonic anhydrase
MLTIGDDQYDLLQFHFHAGSEHLVDGKRFPMEAHFVHDKRDDEGLGVVGMFLVEGAANPSFAAIAAAFPKTVGEEKAAPDGVDPQGLLPGSLQYWRYEGSLTTPPCAETVDWIVCVNPVTVAREDMNARPVQELGRRFVLQSS